MAYVHSRVARVAQSVQSVRVVLQALASWRGTGESTPMVVVPFDLRRKRCATLRNGNAPITIMQAIHPQRCAVAWTTNRHDARRGSYSRTCRCPHEQSSPHAPDRRVTPAGALRQAEVTREHEARRRWRQRHTVRTGQRTVIRKATQPTDHRHRPRWWVARDVRGFPFLQLGPERSLRTTGRRDRAGQTCSTCRLSVPRLKGLAVLGQPRRAAIDGGIAHR